MKWLYSVNPAFTNALILLLVVGQCLYAADLSLGYRFLLGLPLVALYVWGAMVMDRRYVAIEVTARTRQEQK